MMTARASKVDINPSMLAEGERRAEALPVSASRPRLEFVTADARKLPAVADRKESSRISNGDL